MLPGRGLVITQVPGLLRGPGASPGVMEGPDAMCGTDNTATANIREK